MAPPRVFISYSHDSPEHEDHVLELADALRKKGGVEARLDQYESDPPQGWAAWCDAELARADFVLMICTETYLRRVNDQEEPEKGHGVLWEAHLIREHFYQAGSTSRKFVPVLLAGGSPRDVPTFISGATIHNMGAPRGFEKLVRTLTNQPLTPAPPIGELPMLPPRPRRSSGFDLQRAVQPTPPQPPPVQAAIDATPAVVGQDHSDLPILEEGWEIVDTDTLAGWTAARPTAKLMSDWFDGQFPTWQTAMAEGVRPREIIEDIAHRFNAAHRGAPRPLAVLLTGAGGEGKSAALLQTAGMLLRGQRHWTCLRRSAAAALLPQDLLGKLENRPGHAWIVAIDDAENAGADLLDALRRIQPRTDVHVIMAARDADWSIRNLSEASWVGVAEFRRVTLAGLTSEDARRIADGWIAYGPEAMGNLRGRNAEQAADALLVQAKEQAARKEEGALLGALLITRSGEDLKSRVIKLMQPWEGADGIDETSLLDIYAMIAAMHSENQLYLTQAVLALALHCDESRLARGPLRILRREAMVDSGTTYVLTRHRRIAETACAWLVENGYDLDRWYGFLAKAGRDIGRHGGRNPDIVSWQYGLLNHFIRRGRGHWHLAVALAKAAFEDEKNNPLLLTAYAGALRRTDQPDAAMRLLRQEGTRFPHHRGVLNEWSVSAGWIGDFGLDAWLAGRGVADDVRDPIIPNQAKLCLAGLGNAFRELRSRTDRDAYYAAAQAASGRLGLRLAEVDPQTRQDFVQNAAASPAPKVDDLQADLRLLRNAVIEAALEVAPDHDPPFFERLLDDPEGYRFTMLAALLSGKGGNPARGSSQRPRRST